MTSFSFDYLSTTGQTLAGSEFGVLASGGGISTGGPAVYVSGIGAMLVNSGAIFGSSFGINSIARYLSINNSGTISGAYDAIFISTTTTATNAFINNSGTITGIGIASGGIFIQSGGNEIINSGTIAGNADDAIQISSTFGAGTLANRIVNSGMLVGGVGYNALRLDGDADTVINSGTMIGAVDLGANNDIFTNRNGTVVGNVFMGSGNDSFDNRGGTVDGTIDGGANVDLFFAGASAETLDGGSENDTLDFRTSTGVTAALDNSLGGTGWALGDTYTNIENINGSLSGVDFLRGSNQNNILLGFGGNDRLEGLGGGDILRGGAGSDTLVGGTGNEWFQYTSASEGGDVILDFTNAAGNNDQFRISAAGFGGGLVAGALAASQFQVRADNLAQDADDRFIYRTTDQTLWFDVNGNAAGGLTMVADLQAGAVLTVADIFMF